MPDEEKNNKNQNNTFIVANLGMEIELTATAALIPVDRAILGEHEWPAVGRINSASDLQLILWARYLPIAKNSAETTVFNRIRHQISERKLLLDDHLIEQKDYKQIISQKLDRLQKFKSIPAFSELDDEQMQKLMERSAIKHYPAGATIIGADNCDQRVHYLYSGAARVVSRDVELYTVKRRGDILSELDAMHRSVRQYSVHAVEDTTCILTAVEIARPKGKERSDETLVKTLVRTNQMLRDRLELTTRQLMKAKAIIHKLSPKK
ncbi:MAG: cyclic nucleotide-binding domain-containing protein [Deltaproteobacteria bacterium]|nr:cyclic nucleotide-binding domain-containing protein [Deltaproteobacteria bacterium]